MPESKPDPKPKDELLGRLAVETGYITREQLAKAQENQLALKAMEIDQDLGVVLSGMNLLTEDQLQDLRNTVAVKTGEARLVAGYEVISKIGQGGMGAVYKAKKLDTEDFVALKILLPSLASKEYVTRFERESRTVQKLRHDNIVKCVEFGRDPKRKLYFCALEFIEGEDLSDHVRLRGALPQGEAVSITRQIASALQHAYQNGLVHRDVKPENIMVTPEGVAKLLDLGLARPVDYEASRLTQSGVFMGSPYYASPEQAKSESDLDVRSDIYSLGATLYFMVTAEPPFKGEQMLAVLQAHTSERVRWPADVNPAVSEGLCLVILKMMAKDPEDRHQEPGQVLRDLDGLDQGLVPEVSMRVRSASTVAPLGVDLKRRRRPPSSRRLRSPRDTRRTHYLPGAAPGAAPGARPRLGVSVALGAAVPVLLAAGLLFVMLGGDGERDEGRPARPPSPPPVVPSPVVPSPVVPTGARRAGGVRSRTGSGAASQERTAGAPVKEPAFRPRRASGAARGEPGPPSPGRGLVGHWKFDEAGGTVARDSSGNGNHGAVQGARWAEGRTGGALDFDGVDDVVVTTKTATDLGIGGNGPRTVSLWCLTRAFNDGGLFQVGPAGADGRMFCLRTLPDKRWRVQYWGGHDCDFALDAGGRWVHFAHVHDGTATKIYADGELVASKHVALDTMDGVTFRIGVFTALPRHFNGLIDDVRLYDRALDQEEVRSLVAAAGPLPPSIVGSGPASAFVGRRYSYTVEASGSPRPTVEFTGLPPWLAFDGDATIRGTPGRGDAGKRYTVNLKAANRAGSATRTFTVSVSEGCILREYWVGIPGPSLPGLTSNARYPDDPSGTELLGAFEGPSNWGDEYGTRIHGLIRAPQTGEYVFWIAGDDDSELWLSTDGDPAEVEKIAHVNGYTGRREWEKFPTQKSGAIRLSAGRKYYVMALHKEGGGADWVAVGWQLPDGTLERPIAGERLSPWDPGGVSALPAGEEAASPGGRGAGAGRASDVVDTAEQPPGGRTPLDEFYRLVRGGAYSLAERYAFRRAEGQTGRAKEMLVAASRAARALSSRQVAVHAAVRELVGRKAALRTAAGVEEGKVDALTPEGVRLLQPIVVGGRIAGETRITVRWTDLAPEQDDEFAARSRWKPEGPDGHAGLAILAATRGDIDLLADCLDAAGDHVLTDWIIGLTE